ncbi:hypothetical protein CSA08_03495 [Candidatus Gracilibacteria bacterium]|nr:MAG: hypothetical protein CSA08_03495 [Candidatus Gracilibacteria bacterium]
MILKKSYYNVSAFYIIILNTMKKYLAIVSLLLFSLVFLSSCGNNTTEKENTENPAPAEENK